MKVEIDFTDSSSTQLLLPIEFSNWYQCLEDTDGVQYEEWYSAVSVWCFQRTTKQIERIDPHA
jgi:hypothetical protein